MRSTWIFSFDVFGWAEAEKALKFLKGQFGRDVMEDETEFGQGIYEVPLKKASRGEITRAVDHLRKILGLTVTVMNGRYTPVMAHDLRSKTIRLAYENPRIRPHLLPLLKKARGKHVIVKELPDSVQKVLREVGYGRRDIEVQPGNTYQMAGASGDGSKAFAAAVNLETGKYKIEWGSWGGANMFNPGNAVDLDTKPRPIRPNMVVVSGTVSSRPTWAYLTVLPANLQKLLGEGDDASITMDERKSLEIIGGIKSGYRKDEFWRQHLGDYSLKNPIIQSLLDKDLIKTNRAGAIMITLKGKNAR